MTPINITPFSILTYRNIVCSTQNGVLLIVSSWGTEAPIFKYTSKNSNYDPNRAKDNKTIMYERINSYLDEQSVIPLSAFDDGRSSYPTHSSTRAGHTDKTLFCFQQLQRKKI